MEMVALLPVMPVMVRVGEAREYSQRIMVIKQIKAEMVTNTLEGVKRDALGARRSCRFFKVDISVTS